MDEGAYLLDDVQQKSKVDEIKGRVLRKEWGVFRYAIDVMYLTFYYQFYFALLLITKTSDTRISGTVGLLTDCIWLETYFSTL